MSSVGKTRIPLSLPNSIRVQLDRLIVNRTGTTPNSTMQTTAIEGAYKSGQSYIITREGLRHQPNIPKAYLSAGPRIPVTTPPFVKISPAGKPVIPNTNTNPTTSNILGASTLLPFEIRRVDIPGITATPETLAYYGARLCKEGDTIQYETRPFSEESDLAITQMSIGEDYAKGYLLQKTGGGGAYLETHYTPHFHRPLSAMSGGYYILAKYIPHRRQDNSHDLSKFSYHITAFSIPEGYAVYTPPYILHCDGFLTGDYEVVYGIAATYQTYSLVSTDHEPLDVNITPHSRL